MTAMEGGNADFARSKICPAFAALVHPYVTLRHKVKRFIKSVLLSTLAGILLPPCHLLGHGIESDDFTVLPDDGVLPQTPLALQRLCNCRARGFELVAPIDK